MVGRIWIFIVILLVIAPPATSSEIFIPNASTESETYVRHFCSTLDSNSVDIPLKHYGEISDDGTRVREVNCSNLNHYTYREDPESNIKELDNWLSFHNIKIKNLFVFNTILWPYLP